MNHLTGKDGNSLPLASVAAWEKVRGEILQAMQTVMGPLPGNEKRCPLDVRVDEEVDCGLYVRRLISYASEPEARTPAYLLIPKTALTGPTRHPAVLCLHPTDHQVGHKVVVGLSEKENRSYAAELAERGFVTLAPSYPLLADYYPDTRALGYQGGTMKAIWDNIRGLDLLDTLLYVRSGGYGAIGHSLGGHNSIYTAVFDPRIRAIVSSCGFDSYQDYMDGDIAGWTSERYMPKLLEYSLADIPFDFHDMIAALAPRHCLISAPLRDSNFRWRSVDRVVEVASRVYGLYQASAHLRLLHPDCEHDFLEPQRREAYELFVRCLSEPSVTAQKE